MVYKVIEKNSVYDIFEKDSDLSIHLETDETTARNLCRKLNLGSGFNGWTPPFFTIKYPAEYK